MSGELSGLDLRRAACEALGFRLDAFAIYSKTGARLRDRDFDTREEAQQYIDSEDERLMESHKSMAHGINIQTCERGLPAIESDPAISEPMFLEWCAKNEFIYTLRQGSNRSYHCCILIGEGVIRFKEYGSTPSEARARAIVEASR